MLMRSRSALSLQVGRKSLEEAVSVLFGEFFFLPVVWKEGFMGLLSLNKV
jgi:hypothetical protein